MVIEEIDLCGIPAKRLRSDDPERSDTILISFSDDCDLRPATLTVDEIGDGKIMSITIR